MPKEIYNEGRVVGYSSYEVYVKHALSEDPNTDVASEREWLSASLAMGSSMLLKVPKVDASKKVNYIDVTLPENSRLLTANTILGSFFFGECKVDKNGWATKVLDYGLGLSNTSSLHPSYTENAKKYPTKKLDKLTENQKLQILQYIKIQDGLILQPGHWLETSSKSPYVDLAPNLQSKPVVRLIFTSDIVTPFYLLLTGFTDKSIISGTTGFDIGSTEEVKPENGDFLGPTRFPWGSKIVFTYPGIVSYYLRQNITTGSTNIKIDHDEDDIVTKFTISTLKPSAGVSIDGPHMPAGDIVIGSKLGSANNYIAVSQTSSTIDGTQTTTIQHSKVIPGNGIAISGPSTPGGNINVSSVTKSKNNFLKVEQSSSTNEGATTTNLTTSPIVAGTGVSSSGPIAPGANITINSVVSSTNNYASVDQTNSDKTTRITVSPVSSGSSSYITISQPSYAGGPITISLSDENIRNLCTRLLQIMFESSNYNYLKTALQDIVNKIYGGGTINSDGSITWNTTGKAAVGNINLYSGGTSGTSNAAIIRTHSNQAENDVQVS